MKRAGGFLGGFDLLPEMPGAQAYKRAVYDCVPTNTSINTQILSSLEGNYGATCPEVIKSRGVRDYDCWMQPLMAHVYFFGLQQLCEYKLFLPELRKAQNMDELRSKTRDLFGQSSLLIAQEFLYTEFDWRIGVLNNRPLYACRYHMVKNHWQIFRHGDKGSVSGGFETLPTFEVPRPILQAALAATRPIGDGLYGVDLKEVNGKGYVIEVNDNPNIDSGVEDQYLGKELYYLIMQEFKRRLELQ